MIIPIKSKKMIESIFFILILIFSGLSVVFISPQVSNTALATSCWEKTTDKDLSNGTLTNLTIIGNGENAKLMLDLSGINEWNLLSPQYSPTHRFAHAIAPIWGTDRILLFGGNDSNVNDETWLYDTISKTWAQSLPIIHPSAREWHNMASVYGDDKVVLFGGVKGTWPNETYYNETWVYDASDDIWENTNPINSPSPRTFHGMSPILGDDKILLFGGYGGFLDLKGDTFIYDVSDRTWTEIIPSNIPNPRYGHGMAPVYGTDNVVLYGGGTHSWPYDETWIYNDSAETWTQRTPENKPNVKSHLKMATFYNSDTIILFGGTSMGTTYLDETWIYDFGDNTWTQKLIKNKPKAVYGHSMCTIYGTDRVLLFGGNSGEILNDTWEYKFYLPNMNGFYISNPYDTGAYSQFYNLSWNYQVPFNTSIWLQLRSAENMYDLYNKSYVGPNGKSDEYYNSSNSVIWNGHNGDRYIQYKIKFNINNGSLNSPDLMDISIHYNCLPTTKILDPVNGSMLTINNPTFRWIFNDFDSEYQKSFQVIIDNDKNFTSIDFNTGIRNTPDQYWEFPTGTLYKELPDGTWYWKVRTRDLDDVWTNYSYAQKMTIDINTPSSTITFPVNNKICNKLDCITGVGFEPNNGSGLNKIVIAIRDSNSNKYWNGTNWNPFKSWLSVNGTYAWLYNTSSIIWPSSHVFYIQSRAIDNASNIEIPSEGNRILFDLESPISSINDPINAKWINDLKSISGSSKDLSGANVDFVELSIRCSKDKYDLDDGAEENDYWDGNTWISTETWLLASGTDSWIYDSTNISCSNGNHYMIRSRAIDKAGNIEILPENTTFFFDKQPPKKVSTIINFDEEYTNSIEITLSLFAEDNESGISDMRFSLDGGEWSSWEEFNLSHSLYLPIGDGKKIVYFRVRDLAGNIAESVFDEIILDSTPPEQLQITINEENMYTNSTNIFLQLHAFDAISGIDEITYSFNNIDWMKWIQFKKEYDLMLPSIQGEQFIYFKVKDKAGNIANPVFNSIILDTEPPYSLALIINDGASETNSSLISLKITGIDNLSGVSEISFSIDDKTWSAWENFSGIKGYSLPPGDGYKILYFRIRDRAGNIAGPASASINLNTSLPQKVEKQQEKSTSSYEFWQILMMIVIIILIIIFTGLISIYIRNKKTEHNYFQTGLLPIGPGGALGAIRTEDRITSTIETSQLPVQVSIPKATLPTASPIARPVLMKSTQITPEPTQKQTSKYPQLPPAQIQSNNAEQKSENEITDNKLDDTSTPSTIPTSVTTQPEPTISTKQSVDQTSKPEIKVDPVIHLPEDTKLTKIIEKTNNEN